MSPADTARQFIDRINAHDVPGIVGLLAEDHHFIDSLGNVLAGRQALALGWGAYFAMVPDYTIDLASVFENGATVILLGSAHGTYAPDGKLRGDFAWSTPAAFRARIDNGLVAEWQVYADNEPIRRLMTRASA
jgi:ketosteroid isomerase-like protein